MHIQITWPASSYLLINKAAKTKWEAAVAKIVMHHDHLDMSPFFPWRLDLLPYVVQCCDEAATIVELEILRNALPIGIETTLAWKKFQEGKADVDEESLYSSQ